MVARVKDELCRDGQQRKLAKVTSLSHAFRAPGVHNDLRDIIDALEGRGITVSPAADAATRRDVLELTLADKREAGERPLDAAGIRVTAWSPEGPGREERPLSAQALQPGSGDVLWFDLDPLGDAPPDVLRDRSHQVSALLQPWCPAIDDAIVRDLLTPDDQPKVETYGDERAGVRKISLVAVIARELPDEDDEFDGAEEQLIFQIVELVVGPGWILTCWQPTRAYAGSAEPEVGPPLLREPFLSHVAHRWMTDHTTAEGTDHPKTSADLGVYLARSLVGTYGASLRWLQRWVSAWEAAFYKSLTREDKADKLRQAAQEVSNFLSMVGEFSRAVSAFRLAGEETPNKSWFPHVAYDGRGTSGDLAEQVGALESSINGAEERISQLAAQIRADMDLLMIQTQASQQESSERLQSYLGKVTGLILVPTFVAGLFGANTALPGGGSWTGFDIMLLLMAVSALASYLVIRRLMD